MLTIIPLNLEFVFFFSWG